MSLQDKFKEAAKRSKQLPKRPSNEELLKLYALFKQGSEGDVKGDRPGGFDFKGMAKYDAWAELRGKDSETAMQEYVEYVEALENKYQ